MASFYPLLPYFKKPPHPVPLAPVLTKDDPEDIKVEPLRRKDIDKAIETTQEAFADDPIARYNSQTPDARPPPKHGNKKAAKRVWWLIVAGYKANKLAFTVNKGEAVVFATPARPERKRPGPAGHAFRALLVLLGVVGRVFSTPEQKRRARETQWKIKHLVQKNLGRRADDLVHVDLLATAPEKQGKGYGTALVKTILDFADQHGRGTSVITDTESNVEFYESLGFENVDETLLGDHNPTWHEKPVVVTLLVREYKKGGNEKAALSV